MRQFALLVGAILLLGACETATEEVDLEQEFADRRASRGYVSGTPEFKKRVEDERQIRLVRRSAGAVYQASWNRAVATRGWDRRGASFEGRMVVVQARGALPPSLP